MSIFNHVALQYFLLVRSGRLSGRLKHRRARARLGGWAAALLAVGAFGGMVAIPALAGSVTSGANRISFYGNIGSIINSQNPLLVRPSTLLLTEDGSVALVHLRWSGWGTSIARATGVWSASNCAPSCAAGKLTTRPARLTLSSAGIVGGHLVYRCFQISPPHPKRDIEDHGCIRQQGFNGYSPVSAR